MFDELKLQIAKADAIRADAEAEEAKATAILIRKLGQKNIWERAAERTTNVNDG